jgi:hypothetical protein
MTKSFKMLSVVLALFANVAFAADNSIYIDQAGDNSTIGITQSGAGNVVRGIQGVGTSNATPAKINGNGNTVTVNQVGQSNTLDLGINTSAATGATSGNTYSYSVTGNNATAVINSNNAGTGVSGSNAVDIAQTGNNANANVNILGSKNVLNVITSGGSSNSVINTTSGDSNTNNISMTGGGSNSATINQTTSNADITLTSLGASNTFTVSQDGVAGTNGHSTTLDFNGSSNTASVTQAGTIDTTVNVKSVGSGNAFTINTHN